MYAQIAEDGDNIENPSVAWPDTRKQVLLGIIEIQNSASNTSDSDKQLSFIPNNIPDGIATADPMLNFRSHAYPISVKERQYVLPLLDTGRGLQNKNCLLISFRCVLCDTPLL